MKVISWNIAGQIDPWHVLADSDADIALLQEAGTPPQDLATEIEASPGLWNTPGSDGSRYWRAAIVKLSSEIEVEWIEAVPLGDATSREFAVSRPGTIAAAMVKAPGIEPFIAISMYSLWTRPHSSTNSSWIVSDSSAHRLVSDISAFVGRQQGHRVLAAGDLNILLGYGEYGNRYWAERYQTVFDRMEAIGLPFIGPQSPCGRQARPWPDELPRDSRNVPTYASDPKRPATATRQLDFVFASTEMKDSLAVSAVNEPETWGPSDHCRLVIEVS